MDAADLWRRWGGLAIGAVVLALLAVLVWYLLSDTASQKRQVADAPMLMLPPPPPPPPEPEKLPEPEPEKIKPEIVEREPTPVESTEPPKDDAPPSPSQDLGDPVTIDGPAQAGTDAFGIAAGRGGGMTGGTGGGLGSGSYGRYVANALQQALARDPRTRQLTFDDIQIDLWLDAAGKTTRVQLVKSTGNVQSDEAVLAMAREMNRIDEGPPASARFPMRVSMKGRRP
jgi:TonB family protein